MKKPSTNFLIQTKNLLKKDKNLLSLLSSLKDQHTTNNTVQTLRTKLSNLFLSTDLKYYIRSGRVTYSIKPQPPRARNFWTWKMLYSAVDSIRKSLMPKLLNEIRRPTLTKRLREKKIELINDARLNYYYRKPYIFRQYHKLIQKKQNCKKVRRYKKIFGKNILLNRSKAQKKTTHKRITTRPARLSKSMSLITENNLQKKTVYGYLKRIFRLIQLEKDNIKIGKGIMITSRHKFDKLWLFKRYGYHYHWISPISKVAFIRKQITAFDLTNDKYSINERTVANVPYKVLFAWNKKSDTARPFRTDRLCLVRQKRHNSKYIKHIQQVIRHGYYPTDKGVRRLRFALDPLYFHKKRQLKPTGNSELVSPKRTKEYLIPSYFSKSKRKRLRKALLDRLTKDALRKRSDMMYKNIKKPKH